jgi:hypothetical protein
MKRIANAIARWYNGEYVAPDYDPHIVMMGHQRYHWSARAVRSLVEFYLEHWKWLWTPIIAGAIAGLLATFKKS